MILFFVIFMFVASVANSTKPDETMDINLETTLLFDPKDTSRDLVLISKLRNFLDTIEAVIEKQPKMLLRDRQSQEVLKTSQKETKPESDTIRIRTSDSKKANRKIFTTFLEDLGNTLLKYKDDEMKNITETLKNEVIKLYAVKRSKKDKFPMEAVYEKLLSNADVKNYIKSYIKKWPTLDTGSLQAQIKDLLDSKNNDAVAKLFKKLNILYNEKDEKIFNKIVKIVSHFPNKPMDLSPVIFKGLKYIVFDRKTNKTVKDKLLKYADQVGLYIENKNQLGWHLQNRRAIINEIFPSLRKSEEDDKATIDTNITNKSLEEITKDSDEAEEGLMLPSNIILNKNLEINVVKSEVKPTMTTANTVAKMDKPTTQKPKTTSQRKKTKLSKAPEQPTNNNEIDSREGGKVENNENTKIVDSDQKTNKTLMDELFAL